MSITPEEAWDAKAYNPFVLLAHSLLKQLPGAAFDGEPFMLTSLDNPNGFVSVHCFYHTVVFQPKVAAIFTNEAGGMCPIAMEYFDKGYRLDGPDGLDPSWFASYLEQTKKLLNVNCAGDGEPDETLTLVA